MAAGVPDEGITSKVHCYGHYVRVLVAPMTEPGACRATESAVLWPRVVQ